MKQHTDANLCCAAADKKELLAADATRNPTIHRFYNHAACQASGQEYPLPEPQEDVLVRETFLPNSSLASAAKALLEPLPELFPIKIRVRLTFQSIVDDLMMKKCADLLSRDVPRYMKLSDMTGAAICGAHCCRTDVLS